MADDADLAQDYIDRAMRSYYTRRMPPAQQFRASTECADCGDDIPPERLKIFPDAIRCAECQGYYEESITRG